MLLDQRFQFVLDDPSEFEVVLAGIKHSIQVFPDDVGRVLAEDLDDDTDTDDGLLVKGVPAANGDEGVHVDLINKDVALEDRPDENGHATQVLVVLADQDLLDVLGDGRVDAVLLLLLRGVVLALQEELEAEDVTQVLSGDVALVDLAQPGNVDPPAVADAQRVQDVHHLVEVLLALLVDGADGAENLFLGEVGDGLVVLVEDLLDGLLQRPLALVGAPETGKEEVVAEPGLPLLLGAGLLFLLEDAGVDGLDGVLLGDVIGGEVGHLRVIVLHLPHGLEVHGVVVDHDLGLRVGLLLLGLGLQLHHLALLEPQLLLVPLDGLEGVGVDLETLDAVEQVLVPRLVSLEHVLDGLDVLLLLLQLLSGRSGDALVRLTHPRDADQQQPLDETLEDVVAVDRPQGVVVVDRRLQTEQQVCQDLQVVRDAVQLLQTVAGVPEHHQKEVVGVEQLFVVTAARLLVGLAVADLRLGNTPQRLQRDLHLMLAETETLIDQYMFLPIAFMREPAGLEVGLEELLEEVVVEVALGEVLDEFAADGEVGGFGVEDADLLEEGLSEEFVLDVGPVHLLDEGEDLDDLGVALVLQQALGEHEDEVHVLAVVEVDVARRVVGTGLGCQLEVGVDVLQRLQVEPVEVDVVEVGDELLAAVVVVPLLADGVDVEGVHGHLPLLEDLHQFELGVLLVAQAVVALLEDVEDVLDLALDLLVELDGLVGVDGVEGVADELLDVVGLVDVELLEHVLVVEDALDDVELLPLDEDLAVGEEQLLLGDVVVDGLEDVEEDGEHVAAEVERDLLVLDADGLALDLLREVAVEQDLEDLVVLLVVEHVEVGELLAVEDVEDAQAPPHLHDLVHLHPQRLRQLDLLHQLDEVLRVRVLPDLQLHAEPVDQQLDQRLVLRLEHHPLVQHLLYEDLQLDTRTVLALDEGLNHLVELHRVQVQLHVQVAELVEDELLTLTVLQEEQRHQVLRSKLRQLLSRETRTVVCLLLAEVVLQHELVHGGVETHRLVGLAREPVVVAEDLDQLGRELLLGVGVGLVGVLAHLHVELGVVELLQLVLVLLDSTADQPVLAQLLRPAVAGVDERVDGVGDLAGGVVLVQFAFDAFLAELAVELDGGHVREPEVLLLADVVHARHLEVELHLRLVLGLVHEERDLEGVVGQQVVVDADHVHQLLRTEVGEQVHDELLVVLQDDDAELLEDVAKVDDLLLRLVHHHVQRVHLLDLGVEVVLDDLHQHVDQTAVVDLVQVAVVQPLVLVLQLDLPQQEVVLYVLLQHLL